MNKAFLFQKALRETAEDLGVTTYVLAVRCQFLDGKFEPRTDADRRWLELRASLPGKAVRNYNGDCK